MHLQTPTSQLPPAFIVQGGCIFLHLPTSGFLVIILRWSVEIAELARAGGKSICLQQLHHAIHCRAIFRRCVYARHSNLQHWLQLLLRSSIYDLRVKNLELHVLFDAQRNLQFHRLIVTIRFWAIVSIIVSLLRDLSLYVSYSKHMVPMLFWKERIWIFEATALMVNTVTSLASGEPLPNRQDSCLLR